ncbi:MAG: pyridoxamine 5'-phosphate oxidase [Flavobacteriales bacterium]|nr:pyridoxamine 5'-phosphate oxidase [Flavobacteriales bacterium]
MEENLFELRKNYAKYSLLESNLKENPMELFRDWYEDAQKNERISEANAMSICTVENGKIPRSRMVLLKRFTWEGFVFFTNYDSRKGKAIENNNEVCAHFYWDSLERQVIIQAKAEKLAENLSDGYFSERPRGSQLGAIASPQSSIIKDREELENNLKDAEIKFQNADEIPRPKNWGGYLLKPYEIEFWQGRPNRLHDRIVYQLQDDYSWKINRLAP